MKWKWKNNHLTLLFNKSILILYKERYAESPGNIAIENCHLLGEAKNSLAALILKVRGYWNLGFATKFIFEDGKMTIPRDSRIYKRGGYPFLFCRIVGTAGYVNKGKCRNGLIHLPLFVFDLLYNDCFVTEKTTLTAKKSIFVFGCRKMFLYLPPVKLLII